MQGLVLTQTDDLSLFLTTIRSNHIPLLKVVTGWGWHWDAGSIAHVCQTMPDLMVRTVAGDGCRPPPPGQGTIFLEPSVVQSELSPWLSARPDCWCELGNEPNMYDSSDEAAWVFRYWFLETASAMRAQFPAARLVAPGLTSKRQYEWWNICQDAFRRCDAIGFHAYSHYDADDTGDLGRAFAQLDQFFPEHPWLLTEYGIHDPATAPTVKATRYSVLYAQLPGQVEAACWYHCCDQPMDADQAAYALPYPALPYLESEDVPMSVPINKTKYVSKNYDHRPDGTVISSLVIHTTEGSFDGDMGWMCNPTSQVSTHYGIGPDGTVYQLVDPAYRAWHAGESNYAGKANYNNFSIGVEISHLSGHAFGTQQYPALTALCRQLLKTYSAITRTYVVMHRQIAPDRKTDPSDVSDSQFANWADHLFVPSSVPYTVISPCAVLTDRRGDAPLAGGPNNGQTWLEVGDVINVGQIQDGWIWVSDNEQNPPGIGFIPSSYAKPV